MLHWTAETMLVLVSLALLLGCPAAQEPTFTIDNDRFIRDGRPFQIISGSMHYFRIHPAYWRDRLTRARAMGLNAVEVYVPWNLHEPYPGDYQWEGFADVERFLGLAQELGLVVVLRPGPYICAEWDFGGLPWWLGFSQVAGGRTMRLRTNDPAYLAHVGRWWTMLFSKLGPLLYQRGGPIVMVQIENEYGFCGDDKDYIRHLIRTARTHLGDDIILFTTDPPPQADRGSIPGNEVYTVVDFGPGWFDPAGAFATQRRLNPKGKSPPFCSEFYTGWLSHWGEPMANTSTSTLLADTRILLEFANSTGSLSFYMAHGGTNFGFWGGANVDGAHYMPHITSYDYDCPISEGGGYGQPGIGGASKYHGLREVIANHTGEKLPDIPPLPQVEAYGTVELKEGLSLFDALPDLFSRDGILSEEPDTMEEYGQRWGLILYRTHLAADALDKDSQLDLGVPVHDYASVFADGELLGRLDRNGSPVLNTTARRRAAGNTSKQEVILDILVEAVGRQNFGCDTGGWDFKGLQSPKVQLNGNALRGWQVFPLQLDSVTSSSFPTESAAGGLPPLPLHLLRGAHDIGAGPGLASSSSRKLLEPGAGSGPTKLQFGDKRSKGQRESAAVSPAFYRGSFDVNLGKGKGREHQADTYLDTHGWGKGVAWVNGFNLGWYWPSKGPQMTLYVPGPLLRQGENEVVLLELELAWEKVYGRDGKPQVKLVDAPSFYGPTGPTGRMAAVPVVAPKNRRRVP